jgi:hypothetical protein
MTYSVTTTPTNPKILSIVLKGHKSMRNKKSIAYNTTNPNTSSHQTSNMHLRSSKSFLRKNSQLD